MIPQTITLKNFLSYSGQLQTISLAPYPLICLSGKNGHGKSALLDAMTWALWGQARKISGVGKADEGLVRLGQTHMQVSLEFEQSDVLYRVRREFIKTMNKAQTVLDFEIFDEKTDEFVPLTDKTIRATQEKINSTLGLDFQTFVNTAYLRQGQSNEFSTRTPKERKEIIANILGLGLYDNLRSLASDDAKGFATEHEVLVKLAGVAEQELGHEVEVKENLEKQIAAELTAEDLQQKIVIDAQAHLNDLSQKFMRDMQYLEPFGCDNRQPLFLVSEVVTVQKPKLLKEAHVKCSVFADGVIKPIIFFNRPELYDLLLNNEHETFSLAAHVTENHWNGRVNIELNGVDIAFSKDAT